MGWGKYGFVFGKILFIIFESVKDQIFIVQLVVTVKFHSPLHRYFLMPKAPAISRLYTIKVICDYHPLDMYTRNEKYFIRLHYHTLYGASLSVRTKPFPVSPIRILPSREKPFCFVFVLLVSFILNLASDTSLLLN
jgi:hypothetical protein